MHEWQNFTTVTIQEFVLSKNPFFIIPIGSIEQHGKHLPLGTDTIILEYILNYDNEHITLPTIKIGNSSEHLDFGGTISLECNYIENIIYQYVRSIVKIKGQRILLFNSHGGNNNLLEIMCRKIRIKFDILCITTTWYGLIPELLYNLFPEKEVNEGIHAGAIETSVMMHINESLIKKENITNNPLQCKIPLPLENSAIYFGWKIQDLNSSGAIGDSRLATKKKGEEIIKNIRKRLNEFLLKLDNKTI